MLKPNSASGRPGTMAALPVALLVAALAVAACTPRSVVRGHLVSENKLEKLEVGVHSQDYVRELLGYPQRTSLFDGERWYYIGRRGERLAFFEEEVIEQKVIGVHFDEKGIISNVERLDEKDMEAVAMVSRTTPTAGKELGFIEQIITNLGRFNP